MIMIVIIIIIIINVSTDYEPLRAVDMLLYRNSTTCSENTFVASQTPTSPISTDIWVQASLPVRNGGLGVRRVSSLAPSAFLSSAAGTRDLQDMMLFKCKASINSTFDNVLV